MESLRVYLSLRRAIFGLFLAFAATPLASQAAPLDWSAFWAKAREASPRVQVLKTRTDQANAQVALEVSPPTVAVGSTGMNGPVSGTMERTFEVSQKVPFPTKFASAGKVKDERVNQRTLERDAALIGLEVDAYRDFVDLNELLARRQLILEKQKFFQDHLKRLQAYTISDQVQQLHILEMEATLSSVEADLKQYDSEEQALRLRLGSWLSADGGTFKDEPKISAIPLEQPLPAIDPAKSPYLKLSQSNEELRDRERSQAKNSWLPDLSVTYRRHIRYDNVMPSSHEVVVGIELPFLFPGQPSAKTEEANLMRDEAALQNAQKSIDLQTQTQSLKAKLEATQAQLKLMRTAILPNLEKRMHLLHRLAQTDMESLDLHRSIYEQLEAGQEKNLRLESEYRKTRLELETLVGGVQ